MGSSTFKDGHVHASGPEAWAPRQEMGLMLKRGMLSGLAVLALASVAGAEGVAIDHKGVGCIVEGKHPRLNACFRPAANLAKGRVYFRAADTIPWYYVDMKPEAPCFLGTLPKPRKITKMNYYVAGIDFASSETRTGQFDPDVVKSARECKKDVPAAPFVDKATVTVGSVGAAPAIPVGFAMTTSATPFIIGGAVVATGAAAAGIIALRDDTPAATTPVVPTTVIIPPATAPPVTAPPPTVTPRPPFNPVFRVVPTSGRSPLLTTQDMCASTGFDLKFTFDFESDGVEDLRGTCSATRTYTAPSGAPPTTLGPATFFTHLCVIETGGPRECRDFGITVSPASSFTVESLGQAPASRRLAWASHLDVEGGEGQVVVNAEAASFAGRGRSTAVALGRRGANRVEAVLVKAAGKPGTWRFDLASTGSFDRGSIRIIAGEVAEISGDAVVFRMKGQPGERIVFVFRAGK